MLDRLSFKRRSLLKFAGMAATTGLTGGCDAIGSLFGRMFAMPPLDRDESRFAQATAQMLESGDFVSINFQDQPRY